MAKNTRGASESPNHEDLPPMLPMVNWYDPGHLVRTGYEVLISTIFGRYSDFRLMEAITTGFDESDRDEDDEPEKPREDNAGFYDYTYTYDERGRALEPRTEIWIDYVSDTGDGWNSTYTTAYYLAHDQLNLRDNLNGVDSVEQTEHTTKRGDILVFGGDQVYPTASRKEYRQRLVGPYETALPRTGPPHPRVFATPGNHDWSDSLVSFTRLFCSKEWFAGWKTLQKRSYFALKLPHGWWLLGIDVQLGSDIDGAQVRYFKNVAEMMEAGDRVILCTAEPHWIKAKLYKKYDSEYDESNLRFLEKKVLGEKVNVDVFMAGDLHNYRRHECRKKEDNDVRKIEKITAGGGGAFLHPTHTGWFGTDLTKLEEKDEENEGPKRVFTLQKSFPDARVSRRLCWYNLLFPYLNPRFGIVTALYYWLISWAILPVTIRSQTDGLLAAFSAEFPNPALAFWFAVMVFSYVLFTETHSKWYRLIAGGIHGIVNFIAAAIATYFSYWLVSIKLWPTLEPLYKSFYSYLCFSAWCSDAHLIISLFVKYLLYSAIILLSGYSIGPALMGLYLLVSMNVFGRHYNEAFSALTIQDWKNFIRLKIDAHGDLTIYPVGIRRVARKWKMKETSGEHPTAKAVPADNPTGPELIESPIVLKHRTAPSSNLSNAPADQPTFRPYSSIPRPE